MKKVLKVIAICAIVALVSFCGYILIKDIKIILTIRMAAGLYLWLVRY